MTRMSRPPAPEVIEREKRMLELRRAGHTLQEIGNREGISNPGDVSRIIKRALARPLREPAHQVITLESQRLDRLQTTYWEKAISGDYDAFNAVLKIMERRAKLLGLDHSAKVAEQQLQLETDKVRLIALAFGKALDQVDLTPEQRDTMTRTLLGELRATEDPEHPTLEPHDE